MLLSDGTQKTLRMSLLAITITHYCKRKSHFASVVMHQSNYLCVWASSCIHKKVPSRPLLSLSPFQPIPYLDWIMDVRHHSNSWRVKSLAKKVFCTSVSVRGYVHLCVWWSPPFCFFFFFKLQWPHPPSTYLINNQRPHWSPVIFLSSPLSVSTTNQLQTDFSVRLIPYRRHVRSMCQRGLPENEMQDMRTKRRRGPHIQGALKCDGDGWHHCFRTKLEPQTCGTDSPY